MQESALLITRQGGIDGAGFVMPVEFVSGTLPDGAP